MSQYAKLVRQRRSKNFQANLGLLVHIDGDNVGVVARKLALENRLASAREPARGASEPVAVLVPTWCIETWLLHLAGIAQPPETARLKRNPEQSYLAVLQKIEADERDVVRGAAAAFLGLAAAPPSLVDARAEWRRIDP